MKLQIVPAGTGMTWAKLGVQTFFKQPLGIGGLFLMFMLAITLLSSIPFIGKALALMLLPAATLGLMVGTLDVVRGKFPMPSVLATAFRAGRERMIAMLLLGAVYAVAFLALIALTVLVDGGEFAKFYLLGEMPNEITLMQTNFSSAYWLAVILHIPLSMMFWHAPALVHWHNVAPVKALFFSLMACLRNIGAYFMYMLAWFSAMLIGSLMVMSMLSLFGVPTTAILAWSVPFMLCLGAMFFASIYFTFRDTFIHADPPEAEPDVVE
jgi:hypothetical protein